MSHVLVIKDAAGKELARVPVKAGYTIKEISEKVPATLPAATAKSVGDGGSGVEKVR